MGPAFPVPLIAALEVAGDLCHHQLPSGRIGRGDARLKAHGIRATQQGDDLPLLTNADSPVLGYSPVELIFHGHTGMAVVLNTVRSAKDECICATPGRRARYWRWMRAKSSVSCATTFSK